MGYFLRKIQLTTSELIFLLSEGEVLGWLNFLNTFKVRNTTSVSLSWGAPSWFRLSRLGLSVQKYMVKHECEFSVRTSSLLWLRGGSPWWINSLWIGSSGDLSWACFPQLRAMLPDLQISPQTCEFFVDFAFLQIFCGYLIILSEFFWSFLLNCLYMPGWQGGKQTRPLLEKSAKILGKYLHIH